MTILASLTRLRVTIGTIEPLTERVVNGSAPEDAEVTGGTELALLLERREGIFAGSHIVEWPREELVPFQRTPEFER